MKGISTGDFQKALEAWLGAGAKGLSASTISRLKADWTEAYESWRKAPISERSGYLWVDGLYLNVRLEASRHCLLVVIGLSEGGEKRFLAIEDGYRESEQSWLEVLTKLKAKGLTQAPKLAMGDGALGFWKALSKLYPETKQQRCWVHKTRNVLDKVPKAAQPKSPIQAGFASCSRLKQALTFTWLKAKHRPTKLSIRFSAAIKLSILKLVTA